MPRSNAISARPDSHIPVSAKPKTPGPDTDMRFDIANLRNQHVTRTTLLPSEEEITLRNICRSLITVNVIFHEIIEITEETSLVFAKAQ